MTKNLILYDLLPSPPARAVKMLAKILHLELELKPVDLINKEQYSEDILKENPTHTVPILDDNGFVIWDSHAIMIYLVDKYGKDEALYPKDLFKRGLINQLLFFEASVFAKFLGIVRPIYYQNAEPRVTDIQIAFVEDSYDSIERILEGKKFVSGNEITLADISFTSTLTSFNLLVPIDPKKYKNITSWIRRMEKMTFYEPNREGLESHAGYVKRMFSGEFTNKK